MFLGTYTPKVDDKGRFFLPAKFREELSDGLVITRAHERCLAIYPMETFVDMTRQARTAPATIKKVRDFQRMLAAGAADEKPDKQGRVNIPGHLRDYANLGTDIVVMGVIDRVEIWDAEAWATYSASHEDEFADMNDELASELST